MYKIKPLKSARDDIYKTQAQQKYIMPPPGTMIVVGSTGSGKTTIVGNLLCNDNMLKDYYDEIYTN
jgi:type II secretory ATPase GspE/PulE/Tfp pilus assembly ATPase PilB-like protein